MNIQPLADRVVVKSLKEEEVTKSGIVLPDTVEKEKKTEGEIYSGIAIFTMKGKWVLKTKAEINNTNQSFDFEIQVN
mgnify:CR=1 FL=1